MIPERQSYLESGYARLGRVLDDATLKELLAEEERFRPALLQLLGPNLCLTHVQFVTKLPDDESTASDIPWHQDSGYGELEPPDRDLTVFIALWAIWTSGTAVCGSFRVPIAAVSQNTPLPR